MERRYTDYWLTHIRTSNNVLFGYHKASHTFLFKGTIEQRACPLFNRTNFAVHFKDASPKEVYSYIACKYNEIPVSRFNDDSISTHVNSLFKLSLDVLIHILKNNSPIGKTNLIACLPQMFDNDMPFFMHRVTII